MMRHIHNLTSFKNLKRLDNPRGQIATLLILLTVILIIFVMATMNIGETSLMNTRIANAADSAVLSLASQLSTKARQLSDGLKNSGGHPATYTRSCYKVGSAAIVCAVVIAIIAIIIAIVSWGTAAGVSTGLLATAAQMSVSTLVIAGAIGGAIGGAVGGATVQHSWAGAAQGAVQGAAIGAAMGTLFAGGVGAQWTSTVEGVSAGDTLPLVTEAPLTIGTSEGLITVPVGTTLMPLAGETVAISIPAGIGTMATGALTLTATGYNKRVQDNMANDQISKFVKMMNNMNEKDRMRESTYLTALSQLVDDPNMSADEVDSNDNGNIRELVPEFQIWVHNRIIFFNSLVKDCTAPINAFFDGTRYLQDELLKLCAGEDVWQEAGGGTSYYHRPGVLENEEWKVVIDAGTGDETIVENTGNDGVVVKFLRGLEAAGHDVSFWEPGPTVAALQAAQAGCGEEDTCPEPAGFDQVDALGEELKNARNWLIELDKADKIERAMSWGGWFGMFYDSSDVPEAPQSFYFSLEKYLTMIPQWRQEVLGIVNSLPACVSNPAAPGEVMFWPCKIMQDCCTVTKRNNDDFWYFDLALSINNSRVERAINYLNSKILDLYDALYNTHNASGMSIADLGGINPVTYNWTDARGAHFVKVGVGNFKIANIQNTRRAGHWGGWWSAEKCMNLRDYSDNGTNCKVTISRHDDTHDLGPLGFWNPFGKGVSKTARAAYSYNFVNLVEKPK